VFSSPTSNPSPPTSPAHPGNAFPPMRNTTISAATISNIYSADRGTSSAPLLQIFFEDKDLYPRSKTSTSGAESWPLSDSRRGIHPAPNPTLISATYGDMPTGYLPICLFVVNAEGYLTDIYQQHGEVHGQPVRCPKAWLYIGCYSCDQLAYPDSRLARRALPFEDRVPNMHPNAD
jgi:hypothetical protein